MGKEQRLPQLLVLHDFDLSADVSLYNLSENRCRTKHVPMLEFRYILSSAYGWLVLLSRNDHDCCLWNPTSMEVIQLPDFSYACAYIKCFLSKPPSDPDCFVAFNQYSSMDVCRIGDDKFFKVNLEEEKGFRLMDMVSSKVGVIYGVVAKFDCYELVTIRMVGDTMETMPLLTNDDLPWEVPQPIRGWITFNINYLIESPCGNELLLVSRMFPTSFRDNGVHFRVFRVDISKMVCEEIENLDGRTIFISYHGDGFCRSSESFGAAIKPNCIYYTTIRGSVMYVYDLDDRSTTTFLPCPDARIDPKWSVSCWVDLTDIANS